MAAALGVAHVHSGKGKDYFLSATKMNLLKVARVHWRVEFHQESWMTLFACAQIFESKFKCRKSEKKSKKWGQKLLKL